VTVTPKNLTQDESRVYKPVDDQMRARVAQTASEAVDAVNPGSEHRQNVDAEPEEIQYQLDPNMVQQAIMNTNARLIATMVNNNAMMEVALEQERRAHGETRAKLAALQAMYREDNEG